MRYEPNALPNVIVMGTLDTKADPVFYLARCVEEAGCQATIMDVGVGHPTTDAPDITAAQVVDAIDEDVEHLRNMPRGQAVGRISEAAAILLKRLVTEGKVQGVVGVGGSGGTTICAAAMRALPYGIPKVMVSTLASGNTRWHVDISDIMMVPSLLDIAGLNPMLEMVLNNAANAVAGMAHRHKPFTPSGRTVVSFTMYGTTTPGVNHARAVVEQAGYETWVFHASGIGGRTMERLIAEGRIHGVMDMTLAEIGAHLVGGLHDAGPSRMAIAAQMGLPLVVVPGAADTIVLPPRDQVPEKFANRTLNFHNPTMTTMRTSVEENIAIGEFIAARLNQGSGPVRVLLPKGGVSSIDRPGKIFYDPEANQALFDTLKRALAPHITVIEDAHHIDDPPFAELAAQHMIELLQNDR